MIYQINTGAVGSPHLEYLVQGATVVIVNILAVPGLVCWRIIHSEAGQVKHLNITVQAR